MKPLYCWRCKTTVPMMDEQEFTQAEAVHRTAIRAIKEYRASRMASLDEVPLEQFYRPVQALYVELSKRAGLEATVVSADHVLKHRLAAYGPPCTACGLPLRTPEAEMCGACGTKRAA
jgi:hypothetical protein